jgi:hypothetical protein
MVRGRKVVEEEARHVRWCLVRLAVGVRREIRCAVKAMKVQSGVREPARAMREAFWRKWRTMGESALSGIVAG